jgi:hypothetical protein
MDAKMRWTGKSKLSGLNIYNPRNKIKIGFPPGQGVQLL